MIYITGDTHGYLGRLDFRTPGAGDRVIVTGDFGFVFFGGDEDPAEREDLDALEKKPFEILFVDGNHENFDVLETYPEEMRYGAPVRRLRQNIFWLQRGYIYEMEGRSFFVMGGAYSVDKALRLHSREKIWFSQELPNSQEYRRAIESLRQRNMEVDHILTHTAPATMIPRLICRYPDPHDRELTGFLDWVYHEVQFKKWFFGHFHMDVQVNTQMQCCYEQLYRLDG